jgi:hypothetical protein
MILKMGGSGWANRWRMHIGMRHAESLTNSQINEFLKASAGIEFSGQNRTEVYAWVEKMLVAQEYQQQREKQRGLIRAYLSKVAGLSLAQITRLIRAHAQTGKVEAKIYRRRRFAAKYTPADIVLLAQVDRAHERLSGPATYEPFQARAALHVDPKLLQ